MTDHDLGAIATQLEMDARRVLDYAEQAAQAVADGDLDGASLVLGTQGAKLDSLTETWSALHRALPEAGADWQRARDRPSTT